MFLYHYDVNGGHTHEHPHDHDHDHEHEHADLSGLSESEKAIANDKSDVADAIYEAIHYMQHANEELEKAKDLM